MRFRVALAAILLLSLGSCSAENYTRGFGPECPRYDTPELLSDRLITMAQSVPTASRVPCISSFPVGWHFETLDVRDGLTRFSLGSDRAGGRAVEVTLTQSCDTSKADEVPSDELGARQYEQVEELERYSGFRYYVFPGGCVTYRFDFRGEGRSGLAAEMTQALTLLTRARIAGFVEENSRLEL
ncbi:hypothetical protein BH24ACT26_BH24ACT26_01420 [soil metagenome]